MCLQRASSSAISSKLHPKSCTTVKQPLAEARSQESGLREPGLLFSDTMQGDGTANKSKAAFSKFERPHWDWP